MTSTSILFVTVLFANPGHTPEVAVSKYQSQGWSIHQTLNFRICSREIHADHADLARQCESCRQQLQQTWFGETASTSWTPRCDVIVHSSLTAYQLALGGGVGQSVGCTTISFDGKRVVQRRIDIRRDADHWSLDALPHELTHVVMADRFPGRQLPHWANEGMGVLAESAAKQEQRRLAFLRAEARGGALDTLSLLRLSDATRPASLDAFYHQSASLVGLLVERGTPVQFTEFLELAAEHSDERALAAVYKIDGAAHLTRLWRNSDRWRNKVDASLIRMTVESPANQTERATLYE